MEYTLKTDGEYTYIEEGEGKPLVLLHGLFGALSNFKDVVDHFKPRYKVVIPMLPLYTMPLLTTGVKSLAEFLHDFIQHKKWDKVNLLGNSLGGHVALVYTKTTWKELNRLFLPPVAVCTKTHSDQAFQEEKTKNSFVKK